MLDGVGRYRVSNGLNEPHQIAFVTAVGRDVLRAGDLVFFQGTHPYLAGVSHVGIYVGEGQFIHASAGAGAVIISDLTWGYYAPTYDGAVRLVWSGRPPGLTAHHPGRRPRRDGGRTTSSPTPVEPVEGDDDLLVLGVGPRPGVGRGDVLPTSALEQFQEP